MIKTGSGDLDEFIGNYSGIVLIYGAAGTGKTTLAKICAIEQLKQDKKVVFIDTENGFNVERFNQLSKNPRLLENILLFKINGFKDQQEKIKNLEKIKDKISLVIIDTIGSYYRRMLKDHAELANTMLRSQSRILKNLSKEIPVLILNQVYKDLNKNEITNIGWKVLNKFCDCLIRLDKNTKNRMLTLFSKEGKKEFLFEIKEDGIYKG